MMSEAEARRRQPAVKERGSARNKMVFYNNSKTLFFATVVAGFILDRITKIWAVAELQKSITIIPDFLSLSFARNTGAAFSLLQGYTWLLIIISLFAIALIAWNYKEIIANSKLSLFAGLILAGTLGNLYDRVFYGSVPDFIAVSFWPTFNLADIWLTIGMAGLLIMYGLHKGRQKKILRKKTRK